MNKRPRDRRLQTTLRMKEVCARAVRAAPATRRRRVAWLAPLFSDGL